MITDQKGPVGHGVYVVTEYLFLAHLRAQLVPNFFQSG